MMARNLALSNKNKKKASWLVELNPQGGGVHDYKAPISTPYQKESPQISTPYQKEPPSTPPGKESLSPTIFNCDSHFLSAGSKRMKPRRGKVETVFVPESEVDDEDLTLYLRRVD